MVDNFVVVLRDGRRLTKYEFDAEFDSILPDGASIVTDMMWMDSASRERARMVNAIIRDAYAPGSGSVPRVSIGYRRGYQFAGPVYVDDAATIAAREAADRAYAARSERLQNLWRRRKEQRNEEPEPPPTPPPSLADARARADAAFEAKKRRLAEAWRQR